MTTVADIDAVVVAAPLDAADEMLGARFLLPAGPVTNRFPVGSDPASRLAPPCKPVVPTRDVEPKTLVPGAKRRSSLETSSRRVLTTETVGRDTEGGWMATVVAMGRVADAATCALVGCANEVVLVDKCDAPSLLWASPKLGAVEVGAIDRGLLLDTTVKMGWMPELPVEKPGPWREPPG